MAQKYYIKYFDTEGIQHYLTIDDPVYDGQLIEIGGEIELTYADAIDNIEAIRGQGLRVSLEANTGLTFEDLWSENQKTYKVEYKRDNVTLFVGWLNPEGFFENWVDTSWNVSFDCVDGLGYLENLAFVDDATGSPIRGRKTQLEVLSIALKRTGLDQYINTSVQIRYTGLDIAFDPLANVVVNTERYIKDDEKTYMSCIEVIRDILEPYVACITSYEGQWYIYKPNQLYLNSEQSFYIYDGSGSFVGNKILQTNQSIGSQINNAYPHHCSGNQSISNKASVSAYRVHYKYGLATDLLDNPNLYSADGITLNGWNIYDSNFVVLPGAGQSGATLIASTDTGIQLPILIAAPFDVLQGIELNVTIKYIPELFSVIGDRYTVFYVQLNTADGNYYLDESGQWLFETGDGLNYVMYPNVEANILIETDALPADGQIVTQINKPFIESGTGSIFLSQFSVINTTEAPTDLKGEFHTVQRFSKPSSVIENIKEVATGDNPSDIYEGTLYKADGETPTETWYRKGFAEVKPILQIMGEETLRMKQLPARVFSGDVYGYFNYLSVVEIRGINGKFMPIKYSYNTKNNIISCEFRQIFGSDFIGGEIQYELTYDYGSVVEPTII